MRRYRVPPCGSWSSRTTRRSAACSSVGCRRRASTSTSAATDRPGSGRALEGGHAAIVLDLLLGGLSGYRVCEKLRAEGITTPILVLTAKSGEYDQIDLLDAGADDFLTKPASIALITARLRALIRADGDDVHQPGRAGRAALRPGDALVHGRRHRRGPHEPRGPAAPPPAAGQRRVASRVRSCSTTCGGRESGTDGSIVDIYLRKLRAKLEPGRGGERARPRLSDHREVSADRRRWRPLSGVRGRVVLTVLVVTACLYSLLGTIGFLLHRRRRPQLDPGPGHRGRRPARGRAAGRDRGGQPVHARRGRGDRGRQPAPPPSLPSGDVKVTRTITIGSQTYLLVGHASQAPLTDSLRSLYRGLWIGVPLAVLVTALHRRAGDPPGAPTGVRHHRPGGLHRRPRRVDPGAGAGHRRRDRAPRPDRQRDARSHRRRPAGPAPVHVRRRPRAAHAADGPARRDRAGPPLVRDRRSQLLARLDDLAHRLAQRVDDLVLLSTLDEQPPLDRQPIDLRRDRSCRGRDHVRRRCRDGHHRRRSTRRRRSSTSGWSPGRCATSQPTPAATPATDRPGRGRRQRRTGSGSTSTTTGPACRRRPRGRRAAVRPARRGPQRRWRRRRPRSRHRRRPWPRPTAATSWSATPTSVVRASRSGCRRPEPGRQRSRESWAMPTGWRAGPARRCPAPVEA